MYLQTRKLKTNVLSFAQLTLTHTVETFSPTEYSNHLCEMPPFHVKVRVDMLKPLQEVMFILNH